MTNIHNPAQGIDSAKVLITDYNDPANKDSVFTDTNGDYTIKSSGSDVEENEKEKELEVVNFRGQSYKLQIHYLVKQKEGFEMIGRHICVWARKPRPYKFKRGQGMPCLYKSRDWEVAPTKQNSLCGLSFPLRTLREKRGVMVVLPLSLQNSGGMMGSFVYLCSSVFICG